MSDDLKDSFGYMLSQIQSGNWWSSPEEVKIISDGIKWDIAKIVPPVDHTHEVCLVRHVLGESIRSWVKSDQFKNLSTDICQHNWKKEYYFSNTKPFETCSVCGKKKEDI